MSIKKKLVPKTTNNITKGIIAYLQNRGHYAARINTQGQAKRVHKIDALGNVQQNVEYHKSGSTEGVADIICCLKCRNGFGQFLSIEIKRIYKKGKDKMRKSQKENSEFLIHANGIYFISEDIAQFISFYENHLIPNIINK